MLSCLQTSNSMPPVSSYDEVFSPETTGMAAGQQALVTARKEFDEMVVAFGLKVREEQEKVNKEREKVEAERAAVRQNEANNWLEKSRIQTDKTKLENEIAVIKKNEELLEKRELQIRQQEDQRRRNRTLSAAFIEDSFAALSPRTVLENLTNSSSRIRKHAMANITSCIAGFKDPPPTFVWFTPQDIAPDLLPKVHQLLSTSQKPLDDVVRFTEEVVSAPPVAKALALNAQCPRLADFLVETNELTSRLAVCSFRRMVGMETSVVKPAYEALSQVIPNIPIPDSELGQSDHPAIDFVKEVAPKIIEDCFNNGLWSAIAPLVSHRITSIRKIVLNKVVFLAQHSDRNQYGLVEARTLNLLDQFYQSSSPPPDIVEFFENMLPLVNEKLCRRPDDIQWLLVRLSDPSPKINAAVINAFRMGVVKQDPTVLQMFVKAELLKKLNEPPTQQSSTITKLICDLLPVLAVLYARAKAAEGIVAFLDHGSASVADAALQACVKIVGSTIEDRTHLYSVVSRLNFAKASTLKLYDHAMPAFCKDWVESGDYRTIVQFIQHPEQRIRLPAQKVWCDIICNSPFARPKIVHDGLLDLIFEFCNSQYDDVVIMSAQCCSPMAIEITKAGVNSTQQLVELLSHTFPALRQAAFRAVQLASESGDASCKVLMDAGAFKALNIFFTSYPKDVPQNAQKVLTRLVPFISSSSEDCMGLLQLLESNSSQVVEHAASSALTTISKSSLDGRQTLRTVVLNRLTHPTEALIEYSTKAIRDWIGPDLAQLNDFTTFFSLISHPDRRIQTAALTALRQKLSNSNHQESLEKANVIFVIRTLADSDNPEALNFVAAALQVLALSLARNGHCSTIMDLLLHKEPKVQEGAAAALEIIASGSVLERKRLLEQDIIGKLIGHEESLEQTQLRLLSSVIPKLAIDYLNAGKMDLILKLVDHQQQQIRFAATNSIAIIAGGTPEQKAGLRDALLPRLDQASPLLCEVAANCFSRSLANDLVVDGDFSQLFRIFQNEDARVREPIIVELRDHIQGSDETDRRSLVDAGILPAILLAYTRSNQTKDDLLSFLTTCVLPTLGPSFTQNNGGSTLFPLLTNEDSRIRTAATQALKNAVDSRHGSVENMAKAGIVETLHPLTATDEAIRDLWCRLLPKVAPLLTNRTEVDILFENLKNTRQNMREAASDAITIMAKTSEITRRHMFPALLHNLENPSPEVLPLIAKAISLSGFAFVSSDKESELLYHILNGEPDIVVAAIEATTQLLAKGSSFERKKLLDADVFSVALKLYDRRSQREQSLKLLHAIVLHLSPEILNDDNLAIEMISLFDDSDPRLSTALYQTWSSDPRIYKSPALPELFPLLFDKLHNPSVTAFLREVVPHIVPQLVLRRRLDIIVKALTQVTDVNVIQVFLQETCARIENSNGNEKDWFVAEPFFVQIMGEYLRGSDATTRRYASTIVDLLSKGSQLRSGRIMNQGVGQDLSWIALNGEMRAQQSSLDALYSLFMAAPDHADRLVIDSLPNLRDILRQDGLVVDVYEKALYLLLEIVKQSPHSVIIRSEIVVDFVRWLSPRHSITDEECRKCVFEICQLIAQKSDDGRQALVDVGILLELSYLACSHKAIELVSACKILKALAHTGTFRNVIISAGLKKSMENITSPFHKSTLRSKEEKRFAQASAQEVLETLKLSKRHDSFASAQTSPVLQKRRHAPSSSVEMVTTRRTVLENELSELPEGEPRLSAPQPRRNVSEFVVTSPEPTNPAFEGLRHTRSLSQLDQLEISRPQRAHLPTVYENGVASTMEEEDLSPSTIDTRPHQMTHRRRTQDDDNHHPRDLPFGTVGSSSTEEENLSTSATRLVPRQMTHRRRNMHNDDDYHPRDFTFSTAAEENINLRERTLNVPVAQSTPPSYRSVSGSLRRN